MLERLTTAVTTVLLRRRVSELPVVSFGRKLQILKRWQMTAGYQNTNVAASATEGDHGVKIIVQLAYIVSSQRPQVFHHGRLTGGHIHITVGFHTRLIRPLDNVLNYNINDSEILHFFCARLLLQGGLQKLTLHRKDWRPKSEEAQEARACVF